MGILICCFILCLIVVFCNFLCEEEEDGSMNVNVINDNKNSGVFFSGSRNTDTDSSKPKPITFDDVAGCTEAKKEVQVFVDILKNREKYEKIGAKVPKGFLMVGPPGCGKTLMAKAIAGEAGCNFISATGSDFNEMYIGVGAKRVRDLFANARSMSPCVLFIDEIDAIGAKREGVDRQEHANTLNSFLTELDGFKNNENVLCCAATNMLDRLDSALTRSGRFDMQVAVDRPTCEDREQLFELYLKGINLKDSVDISKAAKELATYTPGISGADAANICNRAAINSIAKNEDSVSLETLVDTVEDVCIGQQRKSRSAKQRDLEIVSYHECGHALIGYLLKHANEPQKVSIVPRGIGNLGYMMPRQQDASLKSKNHLFAEIATYLGGRCAEELKFNCVTTGAYDDIEKATKILRHMCTTYGMSSVFGTVKFNDEKGVKVQQPMCEATLEKLEDHIIKVMGKIKEYVTQTLADKKEIHERLAQYLLKNEVIGAEEVAEIVDKGLPEGETLRDSISFPTELEKML